MYGFGHDFVYGLSPLVDLDNEANLPTWFSSAQLLAAGLISFLIHVDRRGAGEKFAVHWVGLGFVMLYLSLDETAGLHELMSLPLRELFGFDGFLHHA